MISQFDLSNQSSNIHDQGTSMVGLQAKAVLDSYQIESAQSYNQVAYSRNSGLISDREQEILASCRIAIPGLGGVGGGHLIALTRTGIGKFNLADFDKFHPENVNRQYGASLPNFNKNKLDVMSREARNINPFLNLNLFSAGLTPDNLDKFLDQVDLVVDSLDFFEIPMRRLLFKRARELKIPVLTSGPIGFGATLLLFHHQSGLSFDEYFGFQDGQAEQEMSLRFQVGVAPYMGYLKYMKKVDHRYKRGASLGLACNLCSAVVSCEAIKVLLKRDKIRAVPHVM